MSIAISHSIHFFKGKLGNWLRVGAVLGISAALAIPVLAVAADTPRRPNIVIILGDDLGVSDIGAFGSEIKTPNLDSLANAGVRFTNFYTHASCSPTRSLLLSGVDTHRNGLGNMDEWTAPNQMGVDGYEGNLNDRATRAYPAGRAPDLGSKSHAGFDAIRLRLAQDRDQLVSQGCTGMLRRVGSGIRPDHLVLEALEHVGRAAFQGLNPAATFPSHAPGHCGPGNAPVIGVEIHRRQRHAFEWTRSARQLRRDPGPCRLRD